MDWLDCDGDGPGYAIQQLRNDPANHRKLFLAGCGWARRFFGSLGLVQSSVEFFEEFADREVAVDGFFDDVLRQFLRFDDFAHRLRNHLREDAKDAAHPLADFLDCVLVAEMNWKDMTGYANSGSKEDQAFKEHDFVLPARGVFSLSRGAFQDASEEFRFASDEGTAEYQAQCNILRDIFGNPARPGRLDTSWLLSNEGAAAKIAATIYDERVFDQMPELADALERSGCHDERILDHCRSQREHVRGCWVIDFVLGKDKLTFPLGARMPLAFLPYQIE